MAEQQASVSDDGDEGALAAALIADHYAHADVALVWLAPDAHGRWRIEYANTYARRLLDVRTLTELRALGIPAADRIGRLPATAAQITAAELLDAAGIVAERGGEVDEALAAALAPRYVVRRFAVAGLEGVQMVGRHGDLRRDAARRLEAAQRLMATYFEHAGVEAFMKDLSGRYLLVNENFRAAYQRPGADLVGRTDDELVGPALAAEFRAQDQQVLAAGHAIEFEGTTEEVDGSHIFRVVKFPIRDEDGRVVALGGVATDVTESVTSRAALAASEEQLRLAFAHANEGFAIVSLDNRIVRANHRLLEMLGRTDDDVIGERGSEFYHPDSVHSFESWTRHALATGHAAFDNTVARPDGTAVHLRVSVAVVRDSAGQPLHYVAMCSDETARHKLEARARQAEKLEAVGQLAGGIAHDINNLLGGILGYAELVKAALDDPILVDQCEQVVGAALRASDFTSRLLSFARPSDQMSEPFELHAIVDEVVHMLRHSIDGRISVTTELTAPRATVVGSPSQMHGALLNLGLNARDAIEGAGTIAFRSEHVAAGGPYGTIRVHVTDTGVGIAPDRLDKVFDPFYTTKSEGRGTGLGLTSVLAAVHQHHGTTSVASVVGDGSTFTIELPLAAPTVAGKHGDGAPSVPPGTRVLVVVDDDVVRYVVAEALRLGGCDVAEARDGVAAIAAIEGAPEPPEAMVFDLRMPAMGGGELFEVVRTRWPAMCTVLMSGFGGDEDAEALREQGVGAVLQKPVKREELVGTLARCLATEN